MHCAGFNGAIEERLGTIVHGDSDDDAMFGKALGAN